jgi:hypothetical protein
MGVSADRGRACPVSLAKQAWIESSLVWFTQEFGSGVLLRDTVVPTSFVPASYAPTADQVSELVRRVRVLMGVGDRRITLDLFDGALEKKAAARSGRGRAVGHYHEAGGRAVVALDLSEAGDAAYMTAIIAHGLSHVLLLGDRRISAKRPDNERLTDLLTIFFGFGIFTANAALRYSTENRRWLVRPGAGLDERTLNAARNDGYSRLGYLTEQEFGYALACYWRMRGDLDPPWRGQLDLGPRGLPRARPVLPFGLRWDRPAGAASPRHDVHAWQGAGPGRPRSRVRIAGELDPGPGRPRRPF